MPWLVAVLAVVLIASSEALPQMGEGAAPVQLAPAATLKAAVRAQEKVAQAIIKVKRETAKAENQGAKMQQKLATAIDQDAGQQINAIEKQVSQKEQEYVKKAAGKAGKKDQLNWKVPSFSAPQATETLLMKSTPPHLVSPPHTPAHCGTACRSEQCWALKRRGRGHSYRACANSADNSPEQHHQCKEHRSDAIGPIPDHE